MSLQSRNATAMKSGQARWDYMEPDYGNPDGHCRDCEFTCSADEAVRFEYEGRCPDCGGILEADE
jgi:hypothetical protein